MEIGNIDLSTFRSAGLFSKNGASYYYAKTYQKSMESMAKMGDIMSGILVQEADEQTTSIASTFQDFIANLREVAVGPLKSIGIALALMFLIIAIFQLGMEDRLNPEIFVKHFAKFGLAMIAISYSDKLIEYIMLFGDGLTKFASDLTLGATSDGEVPSLVRMCNIIRTGCDAKLCDTWGLIITSLVNGMIISLVALVMEVISYIIAFSRMLELGVRAAGMPIAMGMLGDDGWRGAGGRYIKKFLAVCCQGFVLIMIAKITTGLMTQSFSSLLSNCETLITAGGDGDLMATMTNGMVLSIGVGIASVTTMFKSMGLVNDMFGA